ncbi:MAG: DUF3568 family protein [Deltaproteobacteria bacterium]|nr:DUF3568 family protein [Deltaproteobacteria bacterium]
MKRLKLGWVLLSFGWFLVSGCAGAGVSVAIGGAAIGGGAGAYAYVNGVLKADYHASFEKAWTACERTVADMRGIDVEPYREISKGTISAVIEGKKVFFSVDYKTKDLTTVAIRVGYLGDRLASQRLHDKVGDNIAND